LEAAKELEQNGIDCEVCYNFFSPRNIFYWILKVVNLRTLRPLDEEIVNVSVKKTHHLVSVEFGWPQCGIGSEIIARICESKIK
jgi:pyruvate dehydrogenase E1 component beta subunit